MRSTEGAGLCDRFSNKIADELNGTKVDNTKKICVTVQTLWFNVLRTKPDEALEKATTHSFNY